MDDEELDLWDEQDVPDKKKKRRIRVDKGIVIPTERDKFIIAWIAEMWAARFDQIQQLLGRFPDPEKPFKNGRYPADTTVRDQISRWQRAGWIVHERALYAHHDWVWVTRAGLRLVDLDEIYRPKRPAETRLTHIFAVIQIRLFLDLQYPWTSERRLRSEIVVKKGEKKQKIGPIPDGMISHPKDGRVAIEIQLSALKSLEMYQKIRALTREYHERAGGLGYERKYETIWFYVPTESLKQAVLDARDELPEDDRKRVAVGVETILLARPGRR